ncbi:related to multifunctional cyclin-dependent kinase pho85-like protein [Leishmania tarentolae]|uniref:Related to multifunctional cyclin-dependent kinase pho85-like protein n=1 Tax=Leishmania tarentolae TaxID=5689 RepID=A0A640KW11_LEITA|nr:related to multifunctional cyclin-dependent kinase pho85-like protein [Leishmania tarentolae]
MPLMNVCVYGLSSQMLEAFFARECARSAQPLVASSPSELRFGLVGAGESMGAWGLKWPVALQCCQCKRTPCARVSYTSHLPRPCEDDLQSSVEHYVAQVCLTNQEMDGLRNQQPAAEPLCMPCRLVILEDAFFRVPRTSESIICATPGTVIAGVDQRFSQPSSLCITPFQHPKDAPTEGGEAAPQWLAVLDVRRRHDVSDPVDSNPLGRSGRDDAATASVCFGSTGEQFAFLYNLPALLPRPTPPVPAKVTSGAALPASEVDADSSAGSASDNIPPFCECGPDGGECATVDNPGPLLSLTFYANDPTQPFDQAAWQSELTSHQNEVVCQRMRETPDGVLSTTVCHVTDVRPIPVEGSCWCRSNFPVPALLDQQLNEIRMKRGTSATTSSDGREDCKATSPAISSTSSACTMNSSHSGRHHSHVESSRRSTRGGPTQPSAGFLAKGWCVRPLQMIKPVLPQTGNVDSTGRAPLVSARTQHMWTCLLNLRELEEFAIEVSVKVPYISGGMELSLQGNTVLFSGMLRSSTSGTVLLPVYCPVPAGAAAGVTPLWMKLYVQYLLVFPLEGCGNHSPLEIVRSSETFAWLTVPTLIGHRGLGKTYTRSASASGGASIVMKCSENTIPSFQAAHARKCEMIEFDVMLSKDRVPVVIHDPLIELMALKREGARACPGKAEYTPVRSAVHKLNYTRLRDLHVQCCKSVDRVFPTKDLLLHHWDSLLSWARNCQPKALAGSSSPSKNRVCGGSSTRTVESSLMGVEDFPNGVPSLREVLEQTPPSLHFNIEVKYPFQPLIDSNLFLQSDAFEVNGFVDAILRVVFEFSGNGRKITFSSFDPNVCLALALKQSRYDVLFLSDTKEMRDLKDYRSFYVEGAIQFASSQHLAGVSMNAGTLLSPEDVAILPHIPEGPLHGSAERGPVTAELFHANDPQYAPPTVPSSFGAYGRAMVAEMHRRRLKVWTWGDMNSRLYFAYVQATKMQVDGVIGDRMPVFSSMS